jgi:hypothetical protein
MSVAATRFSTASRFTALSLVLPGVCALIGLVASPFLRDDPSAFFTWAPLALFPAAQIAVVACVAVGSVSAAMAFRHTPPARMWMPAVALGLNLFTLTAWLLPITVQLTPETALG